MVGKVFISYRRDDSRYQARMIYTAFTQVIQREHVFMDIDSIPLGSDFRKILKGWVNECHILLALIGPGWVSAADPRTGQPRLANPGDFVRIEIAEALARNITVVPVLLDGAPMPDPQQLPDDLKELVYRHAEFVEYTRFDDDVARLIRKLQPAAPKAASSASVSTTTRDYRLDGRIKVDAAVVHGAPDGCFKPAAGRMEWFKDHPDGPEMVVVPAGSFTIGSPDSEPGRFDSEGPQRKIAIARVFAVGRHAVTRGSFAAFVNNTGYKTDGGAYVWSGSEWKLDPKASWRNPGYAQDDSHPVVCINWDDAKAYVKWLSEQTGKAYRLLTEAEREYVARADTTTPFWWGASITPKQANYDGNYVYGGGAKGEWRKSTMPVGSFEANPWGLYNVHGNVWEWCEDVWHDDLNGLPTDGSAWLQGADASRRVLRGGSWNYFPPYLRAAFRGRYPSDNRNNNIGFRVGRTLTP